MNRFILIVSLASVIGIFACRSMPIPRPVFPVTVRPVPLRTSVGTGDAIADDYVIAGRALTNHETLVSNRFPARIILDLSIDNGTSTVRRLAYGLPSDNDRMAFSYEYSFLKGQRDLLTESARIRILNLDGVLLDMSEAFTIAGIYIDAPAAGSTIFRNDYVDIIWQQAGGRAAVELGVITPTISWSPLVTISNCVLGTNVYSWHVEGVDAAAQARIVIRSAVDHKLWGQSGIITIQ